MILDRINSPKELKELNLNEMKNLASEMRELIINKVNEIGGHMSPNLGITEATIALHYVFDMPKDKIIFDVSHQCYAHKMLTGRSYGFSDPNKYYDISGFTAPEESEYDLFKVGHTSTAISLATGVATARDLKNEDYNVIALVGDGSITNGEALEGLNNASMLKSNFIIVFNDNDMSIAPNYGGLYEHFKNLRETKGNLENNFFKTIGFDYMYVENGNDINTLINAFNKVKDTKHPIVVHIHTKKGNGYEFAEQHQELTHWMLPHTIENYGKNDNEETYNSITKDFMLEKAKHDKTFMVACASTPAVFSFNEEFRNKLGKQYIDVGIAEEHAVAFSSAMAKNGAKPVLSIMSSFLQRTYDQISQDLCLNNSPLTMLIYGCGISSIDATHLNIFDIPLITNIPNLVYLAPANKEEYLAMLKYSVEQNDRPIAIRVPSCNLVSTGIADTTDYSILNKFKVLENGSEVAIIGVGEFIKLAYEVKNELLSKLNIEPTIINPRFLTGLDEELLNELTKNHKIVITLEDGCLDGGFGEKISRFYSATGMKVLNFGAKKEFTDRVPVEELYQRYHLTKELIAEDIYNLTAKNMV